MSSSAKTLLGRIEQSYESIGAILLLSISGVMFVDVVGRYFNHPVKGSFDIVEALMALSAFWFLPILSRDSQHISVTIFRAEGGLLGRIQTILIEVFCIAAAGLMAWSLYSIAGEFAEYDEVSLILGLPKAPFVYACSVVVVFMTLMHLYRLFKAFGKQESVK